MSQPEGPILDETVLDELLASVEGDRAFVVDLVEAYLADGSGHLEAVRRAVTHVDAEALVRPAHTLKSSSATVGAMAVSATARDLEMMGRSGTMDASAQDLADQLEERWRTTSAALRAWLAAGD